MRLDLATLDPSLEQRQPGLWFARQDGTQVSYPAHGNAACLAIEDRSFWFRHRNRVIPALCLHHRTTMRYNRRLAVA